MPICTSLMCFTSAFMLIFTSGLQGQQYAASELSHSTKGEMQRCLSMQPDILSTICELPLGIICWCAPSMCLLQEYLLMGMEHLPHLNGFSLWSNNHLNIIGMISSLLYTAAKRYLREANLVQGLSWLASGRGSWLSKTLLTKWEDEELSRHWQTSMQWAMKVVGWVKMRLQGPQKYGFVLHLGLGMSWKTLSSEGVGFWLLDRVGGGCDFPLTSCSSLSLPLPLTFFSSLATFYFSFSFSFSFTFPFSVFLLPFALFTAGITTSENLQMQWLPPNTYSPLCWTTECYLNSGGERKHFPHPHLKESGCCARLSIVQILQYSAQFSLYLSTLCNGQMTPSLPYTIIQEYPTMRTKQKQEEQQQPMAAEPAAPVSQAITYGQNPIAMKCPFCLQHIQSEVILKPEFISIALGISVFVIVPHLAMMVLVIMLMHFTASRKHRCPLCERELGSDGKFLMYFTDEVYSLSLFSAGFIFTKKMLMTAALLSFIFLVMSLRVAQMNSERWVNTTWQEYRSECTADHPNRCLEKYRGKEFRQWEGHLLRLQDNRQNSRKYYLHAVSLFMRMDPGLGQTGQPDVLLTFNSEGVYYNSELIKTLQHGDLLRFNCTLHEKYSGSLKDVMHFHVEGMEVLGHDAEYALFTSEIEEEWIRVHVENRGMLTSEGQ